MRRSIILALAFLAAPATVFAVGSIPLEQPTYSENPYGTTLHTIFLWGGVALIVLSVLLLVRAAMKRYAVKVFVSLCMSLLGVLLMAIGSYALTESSWNIRRGSLAFLNDYEPVDHWLIFVGGVLLVVIGIVLTARMFHVLGKMKVFFGLGALGVLGTFMILSSALIVFAPDQAQKIAPFLFERNPIYLPPPEPWLDDGNTLF